MYIPLDHFFIFPQYCQTIIMGKGITCVYKHSQRTWTYPPPNKTIVVPPHYASSPQNYSTNYCSVAIISCNQYSPVSNITTTNQVDTDVKNDEDIHYFATPRKHNHSTPSISDKNTTTTRVQYDFNPPLSQQSPSTPTTSIKLPTSGKYYIYFQTGVKTYHAAQYYKSQALTKLIDSILDIESF